MLETLKDYWAVLVAFVGALGWLWRLEARGLSNEKEIRRLWTQRKEDLASAKESLDATNKMLTEIRTDIKKLLGKRE